MKFSKCFFEAFEIKSNREKQWWFVAILLRLEKNWKIKLRDLLHDDEVSALISHKPNKHYYVGQLVTRFRNDEGAFLDRAESEERPPKGKRAKAEVEYLLNDIFDDAAEVYVALFLKLTIDKVPEPARNEFAHAHFKGLIKKIFRFQIDKMLPHWEKLVENFADTSAGFKGQKQKLLREFHGVAPYWIVLLATWRRRLSDKEESLDENEIVGQVHEYMRNPQADKVKICLKFLSADGLKLLVRKKINKRWHFEFSDTYEKAFYTYTQAIAECRDELRTMLMDELKSFTPSNRRPRAH